MKILVTGGYGFIGSHLIRSLAKRGHKSIVYDKQTYACDYVDKESIPNTWNIQGDILDVKTLESVFRIQNFDKILHLAAESHVDNSISDPNIFAHTNIIGTMNVLNLAKQYNKPVVHVSTDEVYGALTGNLESWDENEPLKPNSPYSASKASSDLIALSFFKTYGMDIRITRCCNNFGIGQHAEKLLPKSILSAINDKEILIYGDGNNMREWIHAEDHAEGIILVSEKGKPGEVYNIGSGEELSNNEIAKMIAKYTDTSAEIKYITDRPGHDYRYALNFNKIKDLGFSAKRSINDSNEWNEIIRYYKKYQNPQT